jgi:hypothetical protein
MSDNFVLCGFARFLLIVQYARYSNPPECGYTFFYCLLPFLQVSKSRVLDYCIFSILHLGGSEVVDRSKLKLVCVLVNFRSDRPIATTLFPNIIPILHVP